MRRLAYAVVAFGLSACVRTSVVPGAESVRVTSVEDAVKGCVSKGIITERDRQGGLFAQGTAAKNVDARLKNAAAAKGANVLLLIQSKSGYWGSSGQAEAFQCAEVR